MLSSPDSGCRRWKRTGQGLGEELLVGLLVHSDRLDVVVECLHHPGVHEVLLGVVLQTLFVEGGLEVFESQGIVKNVGYILLLI